MDILFLVLLFVSIVIQSGVAIYLMQNNRYKKIVNTTMYDKIALVLMLALMMNLFFAFTVKSNTVKTVFIVINLIQLYVHIKAYKYVFCTLNKR